MTDIREQLTTEYVAGAAGGWWGLAARSLPWAFDDLTRELGDDIYERMLLDPQVIASVNVLRASILAEGLQLAPAVSDPAADGYARALELHGFCESALADMATAIDDVLFDLLLAIAVGARVGEQVYRQEGRYLTLHAIKVKPRRATAFVVDPYLNVLGLLGQRPGAGGIVGLGSLIVAADPESAYGLLPASRFAILSFRPQESDPRGTSALRPAYTPWWAKMQVWQELLRYLAQFASPSLWATPGPEAKEVVTRAADGTVTRRQSPVEALLEILLAFKNGTALALPYGSQLQALQATGDGKAFYDAFALCDRQIVTAILHQTLATMEGQHQTRAASETHADILSTIIRQARRAVALMVRRQILRPLIAYNFGDAALPLTPMASLGTVEQIDVASLANAMAALARAQYLHPSQLPGVDALLGLPPRDLTQDPMHDAAGGAAASSSVAPVDDDPAVTAQRANGTGSLIRSGFNPQDAAAVMGLPALRHSGAQPVTVREEPPA